MHIVSLPGREGMKKFLVKVNSFQSRVGINMCTNFNLSWVGYKKNTLWTQMLKNLLKNVQTDTKHTDRVLVFACMCLYHLFSCLICCESMCIRSSLILLFSSSSFYSFQPHFTPHCTTKMMIYCGNYTFCLTKMTGTHTNTSVCLFIYSLGLFKALNYPKQVACLNLQTLFLPLGH